MAQGKLSLAPCEERSKGCFAANPAVPFAYPVRISVFFAKFMPFVAACFSFIYCRWRITSEKVFFAGNHLKVSRIKAVSDAAQMVNTKSFWNFPEAFFVRDSVDVLRRGLGIFSKRAVSIWLYVFFPKPAAAISFFDVAPEALFPISTRAIIFHPYTIVSGGQHVK